MTTPGEQLTPAPDLAATGGDEGFGLIELVVSVTLLAMVMLALGGAMGSALQLTRSSRDRVVAANLASEQIEQLRSASFTAIPPGQTTTGETIDEIDYEIVRDVEWVDQDSGAGACSAETSNDFLRVTVSVSWPGMKVEPVTSETAITPTSEAFDAQTGNLAVKVSDVSGAPAAGRTVALTGGATVKPPQVVASGGCAFFSGLAPAADYVVTLTDAGFVDGAGVEKPSKVVSVNKGLTTAVPMTYDRPAAMQLSMQAPVGYIIPANLPITLGNSQIQPAGTLSRAGTGSIRQLTNLFPYAAGYSAWAGDCRDADPEGVRPSNGQRYFPGGVRPDAVVAKPGATTPAAITVPPVDVTVKRHLGGTSFAPNRFTPLAGVQVYAVHLDASSCPDTSPRRYLVGTTDASGLVRTGLPYGAWRLEVPGRVSIASVTPNLTVTPGVAVNKTFVGVS